MNTLKNKLTRTIVFLIAVILVCGCTLSGVNMIIKYKDFTDSGSERLSAEYSSDDLAKLYTDLWAFSAVYIRNLNDDGVLDPNSYKTPYIKEAAQFAGFDTDGDTVVPSYREDFDYYVSYRNVMAYSNTDVENFPIDDYTLVLQGDNVINSAAWVNIYNSGSHWYTNGKGFEYYYLAYYDRAFAVYDYDTTGLDSYIDDKGAVIYLNEDGSSPIPTVYRTDGGFTTDSDYVPVFEGDESEIEIRIRLKDELLENYYTYENERKQLQQEIVDGAMGLIPFAVIIFVLTVYLMFTAGYDSKEKKYKTGSLDRIFVEICIFAVIIAIAAITFMLTMDPARALDNALSDYGYFEISFRLIYTAGMGASYALIVWAVSSLILRLRCRELLKTSLVFIILRKIFISIKKLILKLAGTIKKNSINRQLLKDNEYVRRFTIRTALFVIAGSILLPIQISARFVPLIIITVTVLLGAYMFLCIRDLNELIPLSQHIKRISEGDYSEYEISGTSATYGMHKNLNDISNGLQSAVEEQLRSERMKIDLVTNVSHDLKTPLTSIISYIDLLSKEELTPEARDYVTILENKSSKLKAMVSDVFNLAKATSGTDIAAEKLDAVILVDQVLGDMNDNIENSGKEIRRNISAEAAPIMGDGKKLYRALQNLIDNALKYSLDGTRIYISLNCSENEAVIRVQNISSYEMNFRADEITERFVRGDESRTSEGNGLGLSIAKSYTEACGGSFKVEINGDSFTAVMSFPLLKETK